MSRPGTAAPTLAPGDLLAERFRIVAFLGAGAVGEVYEAEDQALGGRVAIKGLRPEIVADPEAVARAHRELHLTRAVTHRNVCRTYDGFVDAAGRPFLTMELLAGETLDRQLERRGRLPPEEAIEVLRQIADGLAAAHAAGVVHRDLKTGNVFLVDDGAERRVVVTDFGLARSLLAGAGASMTRTGEVLGSPAYMAPEQVRGEPVTPATDVYALGVIAYELVTGELPFQGDTGFVTAVKRLTEPPPPPRRRVPGLPAAWDEAVLRCLAAEPGERFTDPREMARRLAERRRQTGTTATPARGIGLAGRRRGWAVLAAGLVLVTGSGAAWTVWQGEEPARRFGGGRPAAGAVVAGTVAEGLAVEPGGGTEAGPAPSEAPRRTDGRPTTPASAPLSGIVDALESGLPPSAAEAPGAGAEADTAEALLPWPGRGERDRREAEEAVALARRGGRHDEAARVLLDLAAVLRREGDAAQAERAVLSAIQLYRQAGDPSRAAASERVLAALLFDGGRLAAAAESLDRALTAAAGAGVESEEAEVRLSLAGTLHALGRPGAEEHLARAERLWRRSGSRAPLAGWAVEAARWRLDAGEPAAARAALLPAIAELEATGGDEGLAAATGVLAEIHHLEGDLAAARAAAQRSLALARQLELPTPVAGALLRLARIALDEGLPAEAIALARSAAADLARSGQLDDSRRAGLVLARAFLASGDPAAASRELAASGAGDSEAVRVRWQAALLAARLAAPDGGPAAAEALARLESEAAAKGWVVLNLDAAFARAEVLAAGGDLAGADDAARRVAAVAAEHRLGLYLRLAAQVLDRR